jgi:hypothetical protein
VRVRSRQARIAGGGTKLGLINPCTSSSAIQVASLSSVFVPGRCRTSWLWATHRDRFTQDMLDRLPVDARTLQGHHRTLLRLQPGAQSDQGTLGGTTVDQLCGDLAIVTDPTQTGRQLCCMHIDTATDRVEHWHGASLLHVG